MKKMMVVLAVAALSLVAQANLIPVNPDFDSGSTGWPVWSANGGGSWQAEAGVLALGWTNNTVMWQGTGHMALANTVYTMTARVQSRAESGGQAEGAVLILQHNNGSGFVDIQPRTTFWFSDHGDVKGTDGAWHDFSISIDTAANPGVVGTELLVALAVAQDGRWTPYGNVYIDSMTLTPEPTTMVLLGLGTLVSLRKRK